MYFSTKIDNRNDYGRETSAEEYELADGLLENKTIWNILKVEGVVMTRYLPFLAWMHTSQGCKMAVFDRELAWSKPKRATLITKPGKF